MRYSSKDIVEIGRVTSGTSAQYIGFNTKTGKKGIYKENGCILGIENDDVREKLSSEILSLLGVDAANIDLVYDEGAGQNTYFSNYIIADNEELVTPNIMGYESELQNPIENMCDRYVRGIRKLTNDEAFVEETRKNFYKYTYICCILDCYDIKPDNLPIVQNKETGDFSIAPYFDFGTAFCEEHKSSAIYGMSSDEILETLFENYYEEIKDIVQKVNAELTPKQIKELFASEYVGATLDVTTIESMKSKLLRQVEKSRQLEVSKEQVVTKGPKGFKAVFNGIKNKVTALISKIKGIKMLSESNNINYEDKEKLAKLGYSSVAEMNADDLEAEMFKQLEEGSYPPCGITTYDLEHGEQMTRDKKTIEVEEI